MSLYCVQHHCSWRPSKLKCLMSNTVTSSACNAGQASLGIRSVYAAVGLENLPEVIVNEGRCGYRELSGQYSWSNNSLLTYVVSLPLDGYAHSALQDIEQTLLLHFTSLISTTGAVRMWLSCSVSACVEDILAQCAPLND